ncbi:MAG: hypothetical protein ACK5O7_04755 [Holosporales bacterium]
MSSFKILGFLGVILSSTALASELRIENQCYNKTSKTAPLSCQEIGDMFYATHLTSEFPDNFVIKAHKVVRDETFGEAYTVVHDCPRGGNFWALGAGIHNHSGANFNNHIFAVVLPFKELYPQLLNVCPADIFTLGDFDLKKSKNVHLFIPLTQKQHVPQTGISVTYHFYSGDLRQSIDNFLHSKGAPTVILKEKQSHQFSYQDQALLGGVNINTPNFFMNLLIDMPHVSYGREKVNNVPKDGILPQIRFLSDLRYQVRDALDNEDPNSILIPKYNVESRYLVADFILKNLREIFGPQGKHPLKAHAQPLMEQLREFEQYVDMLRVDLRFRKRFGFHSTFLYSEYLCDIHKIKFGAKRLLDSEQHLDYYLDKIRQKHSPTLGGGVAGEKSIEDFSNLKQILLYLPPNDLERFLSLPGMQKTAPLYRNYYWLDRYLRWDYGCIFTGDNASQESDFSMFCKTANDVLAYQNKYGRDSTFLIYVSGLAGSAVDKSIMSNEIISKRIRAWTQPQIWSFLREISHFSIIFEGSIRTWEIENTIESNTNYSFQKSLIEKGLSWIRGKEPQVRVNYSDPFNS